LEELEVKPRSIASIVIASSVMVAATTLGAQDRWSLTSPSGISFAEVKDYESWRMVGSSMPDDESGCGTSKAPGCIKSGPRGYRESGSRPPSR
jgi:hypothetical protein